MNKFDFVPNDNIYELILNICDKYNYPSLLKNITDDYVLNKNMALSKNNYTWYVKILSNFKETEEYILNLIESSFTDLKVPIKADIYEMLHLRWILEDKIENIKESIDNLNKRYLIDYPEEELRKKEIYSGNISIVKNFYEIFESKNYHKTLGLPNDELDSEFEMRINSSKIELYPLINDLLKNCIEINPQYINDFSFLRICISFYAEKIENLEEILNFISDINKSELNERDKFNFNNDVFRKVLNNFKQINLEETDALFVSNLKFFEFFLKANWPIKREIKSELFRSFNVRRIVAFLREYPSASYRTLVEDIIKSGVNREVVGFITPSDFENLRKLVKSLFRSDARTNRFFNDLVNDEDENDMGRFGNRMI